MISAYFNWSSLFSTLHPAINYHINASNCGNCSTNYSTTESGIVCTSVKSEGTNCNFSLWFEYCGIKVFNATSIPLGQRLETQTSSVLLPALLSVTSITLVGVSFLLLWLFCKRTKILRFRTITAR